MHHSQYSGPCLVEKENLQDTNTSDIDIILPKYPGPSTRRVRIVLWLRMRPNQLNSLRPSDAFMRQ